MCILMLLDQEFYKYQSGQIDWQCCLSQLYPYWFSTFLICYYYMRVVDSLATIMNLSFLLSGLSVFSIHISTLRFIHVKNCFDFLFLFLFSVFFFWKGVEKLPLYHYVMPLFISNDVLFLKSALSENTVTITFLYLSPFFYF